MADELTQQNGTEFDINTYIDVLRRRKAAFITTFVLIFACGVASIAMSTPVYRTEARLLVPTPSMSLEIVDRGNVVSSILGQTQPEDISTQLQILLSAPFRTKAFKAAGIQPRPNVAPPSFTVEPIAETNIITIKAEGGDPRDVQKLARAVVDVHLKDTTEREAQGLSQALKHVEATYRSAATALDKIEHRLLDFEEKHPLSEIETDHGVRNRQFADLKAATSAAERNVRVTTQELKELQAQLAGTPRQIVQEQTRENPLYTRIQEALDTVIVERQEREAEFTSESPVIRALDRRIARLQKSLAETPTELVSQTKIVNPEVAALRARIAEVQSALTRAKLDHNQSRSQLEAMRPPTANLGMLQLRHGRLLDERKAAKERVDANRVLLEDLRLRRAARTETARVIEEAPLGIAVQPRREATLVMWIVVALAVALAATFAREFLDDRIHDPEDLERQTSLPALARVPLMATDQPRLLTTPLPVNSQVGEAYRALRSSIRFAAVDAPIRRILITSASKGEGKSVTALNLATMMALDGKRVILVDTDLRKPSVHHLLQLPNDTGLSEVLAGLIPLEEALQDTPVENLLALPSGPIPPNPAELLGSAAFDELVELLEEQADVLIFDSAPCLPVTDPLILAGRMDGVVLVVSVGQTRKGAVRHTEELLQRAHGRLLGLVFNRMQFKGSSYYQYYYRYYGEERPGRESRFGYPEGANGNGNGHANGNGNGNGKAPGAPLHRLDEGERFAPGVKRSHSDYEDI